MDELSMFSMHATVRWRPPKYTLSLSHGENMGSSPLGSANKINSLSGRPFLGVPSVSRRPLHRAQVHALLRAVDIANKPSKAAIIYGSLSGVGPLAICFVV